MPFITTFCFQQHNTERAHVIEKNDQQTHTSRVYLSLSISAGVFIAWKCMQQEPGKTQPCTWCWEDAPLEFLLDVVRQTGLHVIQLIAFKLYLHAIFEPI